MFEDGQAFCPAGSQVTGGGLTSTETKDGLVRVSGPLDETGLTANLADGDVGRSWYANAGANTGPASTDYVSTALCSAKTDATMVVDQFTVQATQSGDGQAFCPAGSRVIGGGVTSTGASQSAVGVSGPLDETGLTANLADGDVGRSWYANVFNQGPVNTFAATAVCSPSSDATLRVDVFQLGAMQNGFGRAFCPAGTRVVGGGVTTTGASDEYIQTSGPLGESGLAGNIHNGDVARSFYAHAYNNGPSNGFAATAICATNSSSNGGTCKGKPATISLNAGTLARTFKGTSKRDVIVGTSGRDKINAGQGNDLVCAGKGKDKVKGGKGKDKLFGEGGKDKLLGGGGNDTCVGGPGKDKEKGC
jgi:RTX calcium-binding nonapeptide repeat (4 copies)